MLRSHFTRAGFGPPVLSCRRLSRSFARSDGTLTAGLDAIDIELQRGDILGVVGGPAAGKTILLRCLCGLLRPRTGSVKLCGAPVTLGLCPPTISYVQPSSAWYPFLTVRDVLEFRFARASVFSEPSRVDEVIADLGLASVALRPVAALSGNELRQLAIAEAFVTGASVFLVDSLSSESRNTWSALVLAALRAEAEAGAAVVLAAREADAIAAVATRVLYLENGRVSGCGSLGSRIGPSRSEADDRFPRVVAERVH